MKTYNRVIPAFVALVALMVPHASANDYKTLFRHGVDAKDGEQFEAAVDHFSRAIRDNPQAGGAIKLYGSRYLAYQPHDYLGVALARIGACAEAEAVWAEADRQLGSLVSGGGPDRPARPDCDPETLRPQVAPKPMLTVKSERCVCQPVNPVDRLDPVVCEVVHMLEQGVAADSVVAWIKTCGDRPDRIEVADMVALQRAGAPFEITRTLLKAATDCS